MKSYYEDNAVTIYNGHAIEILKQLPDESVQMCCTSPPYWGLRNYSGGSDIVWGGDECEHQWITESITKQTNYNEGFNARWENSPNIIQKQSKMGKLGTYQIGFCSLCGAWRGQLGLEPTPELYVEHLMMIFREVKRVLRKDGSFYLNIGDTYSSHAGGQNSPHNFRSVDTIQQEGIGILQQRIALTEKCMVCIPERVMFAMIEDGWILRNKCIWHKPNSMPSSVKDRFTTTWEYLYFFTKARKYYFDLDAVREPHKTQSLERYQRGVNLDRPAIGKSAEVGPMQEYKRAPRWFQDQFPPDEDYKGKFDQMAEKGSNTGEHNKEPYQVNNPHRLRLEQAKQVDIFGHGSNPQSFNLRVYDIKRGKGGTTAQSGELKASEKEIEEYEYPEKAQKDKQYRRRDTEHQITPTEAPNRSSKDWRAEAAKRGQLFDQPVAHQGGGNTGLKKHHGSSHDGRTGFDRPEYKGRKGNNPELGNRNFMPTKHDLAVNRTGNVSYTDPLHTRDYSLKGKNPGDVLTERQENIVEHFEQKGSGGHYLYGGIESPEGVHEHPKGKNPGDTFQAKKEPYLQNNPHTMRLRKDHYIPMDPDRPDDLSHPLGKNPGDYWELTTKGFKGAHFAVYPEKLCERPIKASSRIGDTVLDPFAGSGTTGVVAKKLGRKAILIDCVEKYCKMMKDRISKVQYQPELLLENK